MIYKSDYPILSLANSTTYWQEWMNGSDLRWFNSGGDDQMILDTSGYLNVKTGFKCGGTSPVADGTYTVGCKLTGGGVNGTITTKGGIITAVQEAT